MSINNDIDLLEQEKMFRTLTSIRENAPPLNPLWGCFLFKKAITAIIGEPGVCKTTFGYRLSIQLGKGESFLGIKAEEIVKTLYLDFESSDSLIASRTEMITEEETPNIWCYNDSDFYLNQITDHVTEFAIKNGINLIVVDNQSMAFDTRDENDNAEAIQQMRFIRTVINKLNVSCILFHHSNKQDSGGTRKGSGAFARARLADIMINITKVEGYSEMVKMELVKNRLIGENVQWYLERKMGNFEIVEPPLGASGVATDTKIFAAQKTILDAMIDVKAEQYAFYELVEMMKCRGYTAEWTDHAVRRLIQLGKIKRVVRGVYAIAKR